MVFVNIESTVREIIKNGTKGFLNKLASGWSGNIQLSKIELNHSSFIKNSTTTDKRPEHPPAAVRVRAAVHAGRGGAVLRLPQESADGQELCPLLSVGISEKILATTGALHQELHNC